MRLARRILTALLTFVLVVVGFGLVVRIYMGRVAEDHLAPEEAVSIAELRAPLPKTGALACPPDYCANAEATIASPIFDMPWGRLRDYWREMIADEPRMVRVISDREHHGFVFIRHSPLLRFPDIITVEFVPLGNDRSSIAIYSRSRYGRFDFGKNRKRVESWLALLHQVARPAMPVR